VAFHHVAEGRVQPRSLSLSLSPSIEAILGVPRPPRGRWPRAICSQPASFIVRMTTAHQAMFCSITHVWLLPSLFHIPTTTLHSTAPPPSFGCHSEVEVPRGLQAHVLKVHTCVGTHHSEICERRELDLQRRSCSWYSPEKPDRARSAICCMSQLECCPHMQNRNAISPKSRFLRGQELLVATSTSLHRDLSFMTARVRLSSLAACPYYVELC
jgi:hypothetical protein